MCQSHFCNLPPEGAAKFTLDKIDAGPARVSWFTGTKCLQTFFMQTKNWSTWLKKIAGSNFPGVSAFGRWADGRHRTPIRAEGSRWGGSLVMFAYWSSIFFGGIEFQSSENRQFKWIGQVSNFKRRIQSLQLCRERVKHFHFRPIYGTLRLKFFFPLPAFRQRQMGPAAQEQSQWPAQLLALKYPGWVLF